MFASTGRRGDLDYARNVLAAAIKHRPRIRREPMKDLSVLGYANPSGLIWLA